MATLFVLINGDKNLSSFTKGIKAAGMEALLNDAGPFTLLAPVNLAFGKLESPNTFDSLLANKHEQLKTLLSCHIIKSKKLQRDFRSGQKIQTIDGQELLVTEKDGDILINGAKILAKDRQAFNGVVHTIDKLMLQSQAAVVAGKSI